MALLLCLFGCDEEPSNRLTVLWALSGNGPVAYDEPLVILCSKPIDKESVSNRTVLVRAEGAGAIRCNVRTEGRHLIVTPAKPAGPTLWPTSASSLDVAIPFPSLGPALRSTDGSVQDQSFRAKVPLTNARLPEVGSLHLLAAFPEDGARDIDFSSDPSGQFRIELEFNAPLDPRSLSSGIQVVDCSRQTVLEDVAPELEPETGRRVQIQPFAGGLLFNGGTRYEIRLTAALRSRDGRVLIAPRTVSFSTRASAGEPRLLQVRFSSLHDLDPSSRSSFDPEAGGLVPRPIYQPIIPPGFGTNLKSLVEGLPEEAEHPFAGPGVPTRTQMTIPVEWLTQGAHPSEREATKVLITAIDFHASERVPEDTTAAELEMRLGYVAGRRGEERDGLDAAFEWNDDAARTTTAVRLRHRGNRLRLAPDLPVSNPARYQNHTLRLELDEPFLYDTSRGDLLVDLKNFGGVFSDFGALGRRGIAILGFPSEASSRSRIVLGSCRSTRGTPHGFQPYVWVHTIRVPPITTRWHLARSEGPLRFFHDPRHVRGLAREGTDFEILYQGGRPLRDSDGQVILGPDGTPECEETGPFSKEPPSDGISTAIRLRLEFDPLHAIQNRDRSQSLESSGHETKAHPLLDYVLVGYKGP